MAVPEDIINLWRDSSQPLKIEKLDDLFKNDPTTALEASLTDQNESRTEEVRNQEQERILKVLGSDIVGFGEFINAPKPYAYEDFNSFLAREGGLNQELLSKLIGDVIPRPDEDFVSFLARSNSIKDEQMVIRLRQAFKLEPAIEFISGKPTGPVKMETDLDLKVREGEDAASFFVRAGTWGSTSSISEELASAGLEEFADEDVESFFKRNDSMSHNELEGKALNGSRTVSVALLAAKQELQ